MCSPANSILDICLTDLAAVELSAQIFKHSQKKHQKNLSNSDRIGIDGLSVQRGMLQWVFDVVLGLRAAEVSVITSNYEIFPDFN